MLVHQYFLSGKLICLKINLYLIPKFCYKIYLVYIFMFFFKFFRNDVSILESILLKGMGAYPVLSFGSKRKLPPLIFDLESSPMIDLMCSKSMFF